MSGKLLLIYICNFHVLSHFLFIYTCKLHWNHNKSDSSKSSRSRGIGSFKHIPDTTGIVLSVISHPSSSLNVSSVQSGDLSFFRWSRYSRSVFSIMFLQCVSGCLIVLAKYSEGLSGELKQIRINDADQMPLCWLVWLISATLVLLYTIYHLSKRLTQGASLSKLQSRNIVLQAMQTVLESLESVEGFDVFEDGINSLAVFLLSDLSGSQVRSFSSDLHM